MFLAEPVSVCQPFGLARSLATWVDSRGLGLVSSRGTRWDENLLVLEFCQLSVQGKYLERDHID